MLTEEQIQRLTKKLAEEHEVDEEQCEKHVRFIDEFSEIVHALLPEESKELYKKILEGKFFEGIIQRCFSIGEEIYGIYWLCQAMLSITQMRLLLDKE